MKNYLFLALASMAIATSANVYAGNDLPSDLIHAMSKNRLENIRFQVKFQTDNGDAFDSFCKVLNVNHLRYLKTVTEKTDNKGGHSTTWAAELQKPMAVNDDTAESANSLLASLRTATGSNKGSLSWSVSSDTPAKK
ncbi:hypothetical protein [Undibacterium sp. Ji49W]|uniref:hypothetical protein n=1 Tax=Undibacterium sp. Ji49W TaxID=3413040 RepID=UPI003BF244F5